MSDWYGLAFLAIIATAAYFGLRSLSKPVRKTEAEFERSVSQSTSMLNASMGALQELLDPEAAKSKVVQMELKGGRYNKRKREGKAQDDETAGSAVGGEQ